MKQSIDIAKVELDRRIAELKKLNAALSVAADKTRKTLVFGFNRLVAEEE